MTKDELIEKLQAMLVSSFATADELFESIERMRGIPWRGVDNGQHLGPPTIGESIADKVRAPALVRMVWNDDRPSCSQGTFTAAALARLQFHQGI